MEKCEIPACQETLNGLMDDSSNVIRGMYASLKTEILALEQLKAMNEKRICVLCQQLGITVNYSLMDIEVSVRATLGTDNAYEKRFHLKNIRASISESYKSIWNFETAREKSIWSKLGGEINDTNQVIEELYQKITAALIAFDKKHISQDLRNLTLHYDDDMMRVYKATVGINNEDAEMKSVCEYMDILQSIRLLVALVELNKGISMPSPAAVMEHYSINSIVEQLINKHGKLMEVVEKAINDSSDNIDYLADTNSRFQKIQSLVEQQAIVCVPFNELENFKVLLNAQMLLQFMIGDVAAITKAYLQSRSEEEHKMNLRRFVVTQTSTLVHLYGYNDAEQEKSIWKLLMSFLPQSDSSLIKECDNTEEKLQKLVTDSVDKKERALYVHLVNGSKSKFGIPDTLKAIDAIDPIREIVEVNVLLVIMNQVRDLLNHVMNILSKEVRKSRQEDEHKIEKMFDDMIRLVSNGNLPEEQKIKLLEMFSSVKENIMNIVSR